MSRPEPEPNPQPARCAACNGEVRIVSLTDAGASYACPCGRTTWTQLTIGSLAVLEDAK